MSQANPRPNNRVRIHYQAKPMPNLQRPANPSGHGQFHTKNFREQLVRHGYKNPRHETHNIVDAAKRLRESEEQ